MKFIVIAGASGCGKTTIAYEVAELYNDQDQPAIVVSMDDYYRRRNEAHLFGYNYDTHQAFEVQMLHEHLKALENGNSVNKPIYSKKTGDRLEVTETINPENYQIVIVEGILTFHDIKQANLNNMVKVLIQTDSYNEILARRCSRDMKDMDCEPKETKKRGEA